MASNSAASANQVPNWIALILAVWLFIAPWILPAVAAGAWAWNAWIVAVIVGALAVGAMARMAEWEEWANLVLGAWLFVSPWALAYAAEQSAAWNAYIVGLLLIAVAVWGIVAARQDEGAGTAG
ncbi:SPW repeat protein [Aquibium sp. A9E412]|uniref:SPW repeat protein n=1 Tax=Aquibium sp. A9E412 TaxID=2976767 RepID=UPI0025B0F9B5|nr:SPW repeat protein [Aquibium sp. A9E412]MDN2566868.1 SPW repeat protein [Aquibium sp. A9E412]